MNQHFFYYTQLLKLPLPADLNDLFEVRFISTANITVAFNTLKAGAKVPVHEHIHETIDYIQEGELEMRIGDETTRMYAGMVAHVPSNILHSARAITNCKLIDIFYPAREDFKTTKE